MIRAALGRIVGAILARALQNANPRVIYDGTGEKPYLSRFYIAGAPTMPDGSPPFDRFGNPKPEAKWGEGNWGLYIHRFHQSDVDRELHNHPWRWAVSLILAGGYREERRCRLGRDLFTIVRREVKPFALNVIGADTFHRVDLIEHEAWSLFLVGPKVATWGFWSRIDGSITPWREFLARKQVER